ncbi:MAG: phage major tail tube protein [Treponema sp.]|nr:phage major tail tube protein [Treponema sp.]
MGIATKNNVFKLYNSDTQNALDGVVTVTLPSFELASDAFKGAGLAGEINVPAPGVMNAMTAEISCPKIYSEIKKFLELGGTKTLDLRNEIVVQNPDTHSQEKKPDRWVIKGPVSAANPGSVEQAAAGDAGFTMQVYYVHHWLDGEEVLEWDPFKYIYKVNGIDMLAETRQNLLV